LKNKTEEAGNGKKAGETLVGLANNIGKIVENASVKTKDIVARTQESIVNAVDKNDNGKIDMEDYGIEQKDLQEAKEKARKFASETSRNAMDFASKAGKNVKNGSELIGKALGEAKIEMDRKYLRPVFAEELLLDATNMSSIDEICKARNPSMICIVERDKKRSENAACNGAVGYRMTVKGMEMLNIYEDSARQLGMWFYPNISKTIYYADPFQTNFYIYLDEYFVYLKNARVSELAMIAKDLGAKKVKITLKEHKKTFVAKNVRAEAKVEKKSASSLYDKSDSDFSSIAIADEEEFSGHDTPVAPRLVYFKNESDIEKLIEMRMDTSKQNKIKSKTYTLQYNKSSGIKEKEAARIDAVLGQLKCGGTASISSEAQCESRTVLEYSIEF